MISFDGTENHNSEHDENLRSHAVPRSKGQEHIARLIAKRTIRFTNNILLNPPKRIEPEDAVEDILTKEFIYNRV